ncbi:hypothetical protein AU186_19830 [Mycobacterium sp. GA-1999]|nr:hypothetical protein AU186_19830 [Mycobacterium sp. GA-1999]
MMIEYTLAQGGAAPWIGPAVRAAVFAAAGVALFVVGVSRRLARTRWNRDDDRRLLHPDGLTSGEHRSPSPPSGGTWLIAAGAVLVILGLLHILDLVATLHESGIV